MSFERKSDEVPGAVDCLFGGGSQGKKEMEGNGYKSALITRGESSHRLTSQNEKLKSTEVAEFSG